MAIIVNTNPTIWCHREWAGFTTAGTTNLRKRRLSL